MNESLTPDAHSRRREIEIKVSELQGGFQINVIHFILQKFNEWSQPKEILLPSLVDCCVCPLINFLYQNINNLQEKNKEIDDCVTVIKFIALLADSPFFNTDNSLSNSQAFSGFYSFFSAVEDLQKDITMIFIAILRTSTNYPSSFYRESIIRSLSQARSNELTGELIYMILKKGKNIEESILFLFYNWIIDQFYQENTSPRNLSWSLKALKRLFKYNFTQIQEDDVNAAMDYIASDMADDENCIYNLISLFGQINMNDKHKEIVYSGLDSDEPRIVRISLKIIKKCFQQFDLISNIDHLYAAILQGTYTNKKIAISILTEMPKHISMWNESLISIILDMMDNIFLPNALVIIHQFLPFDLCRRDICEQFSSRFLEIDEDYIPKELEREFEEIIQILNA